MNDATPEQIEAVARAMILASAPWSDPDSEDAYGRLAWEFFRQDAAHAIALHVAIAKALQGETTNE